MEMAETKTFNGEKLIKMSFIENLKKITGNEYIDTFLLCVIIFAIINFIIAIIGYAVDGLIVYLFSNIAIIIYSLFAPIAAPPTFAILTPVAIPTMGSLTAGIVIMSIGYILSPILVAIIAGRIGESKNVSFYSWFLLSMISAVICMFLPYIAIPYSPIMVLMIYIAFTTGAGNELTLIIVGMTFLGGIINGLFYGAIAMLVNKSE